MDAYSLSKGKKKKAIANSRGRKITPGLGIYSSISKYTIRKLIFCALLEEKKSLRLEV